MSRNHSPRKPTTVAEAIHAFERAQFRVENGRITIHVGRMDLNAGKKLHLVAMQYEFAPLDENTLIHLQSGNLFRAIESSNVERSEYPIELLDGSTVSLDAIVTLQDGTILRAVEIVPDRISDKLSDLDEKIIHAAISIAKIEGAAYRSFRQGLSEEDATRTIVAGDEFFEFIEFGEFIDGFKFIDFGKLAQAKKPFLVLKQIKGEFERLFPMDKSPSGQKISDTLASVGFRQPKRRPKSKNP